MSDLIHGHLETFIDGYMYLYRGLINLVEQDGKHYSVPDKLMPAYTEDVGTMEWWTEGWAVEMPSRKIAKSALILCEWSLFQRVQKH